MKSAVSVTIVGCIFEIGCVWSHSAIMSEDQRNYQ